MLTGEIRDSVPKYQAERGAVNASAPMVTDTEDAAKRTILPQLRPWSKKRYIRPDKNRMPATAAKESCKLIDAAAKGSASKIKNSATASEVGLSLSLRSSGAATSSVSITQARSTEGLPPVRTA